jgi:hypothetical protein
MLESIVTKLKNFRDQLYHFFHQRSDASFELIDALSSNLIATSVVELSLNPVHRRNYCSITRAVEAFYPKGKCKKAINRVLEDLFTEQCEIPVQRGHHLIAVDCTPNARVHSPTQEDRGFVHAPSHISGNKPITIGHQYSIAVYLPEKPSGNSPWILPLSCQRVRSDEKGTLVGMQQITRCIKEKTAFKEHLCVVVADAAYSTPECLAETGNNKDQIQISRLRSNRVVYHQAKCTDEVKLGKKKRYGEAFKLNDNTTWSEADESTSFNTTTRRGKIQTIEIKCWNNLLIPGTRDANVSDIPFRLIQISAHKADGKPCFKKPLWLLVAGQRKSELILQQIFDDYRQRFDIEHFFRFAKNRLLMDKFQTPDLQHEEAWWQFVMMAYAQLYIAKDIAQNMPMPWEKYLPSFKSGNTSPTQVQKDFSRIIRLFGTPANPPKPRNNAPGRKLGDKQTPRVRHPVVQKRNKGLDVPKTG